MSLSNFFKINFPYGIKRNEDGEWAAFNREYKPLGFNDHFKNFDFKKYPLYTKYQKFDLNQLVSLINEDVSNIQIDNEGNIKKIFFYNDKTNPSNNPEYWEDYIKIIKVLSNLVRK